MLVYLIATLRELDKQALIEIIEKPKNALTKQYKKLFEIDGVELEFTKEALEIMVDKALERKTGARGLRSIMEETMRDIMYEIPSNPKISKCTITKETITEHKPPEIVIDENKTENKNKKKSKSKKVEKEEIA